MQVQIHTYLLNLESEFWGVLAPPTVACKTWYARSFHSVASQCVLGHSLALSRVLGGADDSTVGQADLLSETE